MFFKSTIIASALAALASAGSVSVINNSNEPVHLWSIVTGSGGNPNDGQLNVLNANGGTYNENYQTLSSGGVSIKIGSSDLSFPGGSAITQLEYTYVPGQGLVYWDLSNINGNPFSNAEVTLAPSNPDGNSCVVITCPPGPKCLTAYNLPDDTATHACASDESLVLTISNSGVSSSSGSSSSPAASSPAPASSSASVGAIALQQASSAAPAPASSSPAPAAPVPVGQNQMAPAAPVVSTTTFVVVVTPTPTPTSSPAPVAASPTPVAPAEVEPVQASSAPQPYFGVLTEGFFTHDGTNFKHKKRHIHKKRHSRFFQ